MPARPQRKIEVHFWALMGFLGVLFLLGGASRADVPTLLVVRPLAVLMLGLGIWGASRASIREYWWAVALWGFALLLALSHVIPLPPSVTDGLPGRQFLAEASRFAGVSDVWRPLSLVPSGTWNAIFALLVPGAVLFLMLCCSEEQRGRALYVVVACGLFSGLLGLVQVVGDPYGKLYFYEITNYGSAVGVFANRNHQALFLACVLPMLGLLALGPGERWLGPVRYRAWLALSLGVFTLLMILVTGSRAGLALALVGVLGACWVYSARGGRRALLLAGGLLSISLVATALAMYFSRSHSITRLLATGNAEELRWPSWEVIWKIAQDFFPFGSGIGSFEEVFAVYEPHDLLRQSYLNHAHNEYLEILMTAGLPGAILLILGVAGWAWGAYKLAPRSHQRTAAFGRVGAVLILQIGLASVVDYPARTPATSAVLVIAAIWLMGGVRSVSRRDHSNRHI